MSHAPPMPSIVALGLRERIRREPNLILLWLYTRGVFIAGYIFRGHILDSHALENIANAVRSLLFTSPEISHLRGRCWSCLKEFNVWDGELLFLQLLSYAFRFLLWLMRPHLDVDQT